MAIVVRLGPVPLQHRRTGRIAELERIFERPIGLVEVFTIAELLNALKTQDVIGVALDAAPPGELAEAVAVAHPLPVLRPLWRRQRNRRGETDEVFDATACSAGRTSSDWPTASCQMYDASPSTLKHPTPNALFVP